MIKKQLCLFLIFTALLNSCKEKEQKSTLSYDDILVEDGFIILSNQAIQHDGAYMLITSNGKDTEVVGVVGDNLDDLKTYAESIAFV